MAGRSRYRDRRPCTSVRCPCGCRPDRSPPLASPSSSPISPFAVWRARSAPVGRLGPNDCWNPSRNPASTRGSRSRAQPEPTRSHDLADAAAHIDRAIEIASAQQEADAHALALSFKGSVQIAWGNWQDGLALIDEAAAAASSGKIGVRWASDVCCNTITTCRDVSDYGRAAQWIDEAERWMHRQSVGGYPGIWRVHRAELKMLRGRWPEAEQEARHAREELELFRILDGVGFAHYEVGEVRLRMGDLGAAADAFERAYEHGHDAQPGLALLQLAQGDLDEAADPSSAHSPPATAAVRRPIRPGGHAICRRGSRSRWPRVMSRRRAWRHRARSLAAQFERPAVRRCGVDRQGGRRARRRRPCRGRSDPRPRMATVAGDRAALRERKSRVLYGKALLAGGEVAPPPRLPGRADDLRAARSRAGSPGA